MAVPSYISGISLALKNFGTMSWKELIDPSCTLSSRGMLVDWHTTLRIALASDDLKKFESSRNVFLSNGLPPYSEDPLNLITVLGVYCSLLKACLLYTSPSPRDS